MLLFALNEALRSVTTEAGRKFRRREPRRRAFVLVVLFAAGGCSNVPAQQLQLYGTSWEVISIGDTPLRPQMSISLHVGSTTDFDGTPIRIRTGCRTLTLGAVWDSSGAAISFELSPALEAPCAPDLAQTDRAFFAALAAVESWSVESDQEITLHGSQDLRLRRTLAVSSATPSLTPAPPTT